MKASLKLSTPCLYDIQQKSLNIFLVHLNEFYEIQDLHKEFQDPFVDKYVTMQIYEIKMIISFQIRDAIIMKVMVLKNWWQHNKVFKLGEDIKSMLYFINEEANYIHRSKIIFMRNIRDCILKELENNLTETKRL